MSGRWRRAGLSAIALATGLLLAPQVAHADSAGPTDYRSEVVAIEPTTDVIQVSIVGGDSFVRIVVAPGHEVIVLGYDDEQYLRIAADGTVSENTRSYATYYNTSRYGSDRIPDLVDNDAAPDWRQIGDGGSWAWHDHRSHWMGSEPPIGLDPGESLPPETIPLLVDGAPVAVSVQTTLQPSPSKLAAIVGVLLGLVIALFGTLAGLATRLLSTLLLAVAAAVVGIAEFVALPGETGPLITWWLLPVLALLCVAMVIATYGRWPLVQGALAALAGVQLVLWGFERRTGMTRAVLPTDLPFWLDRTVTGAALAGGAVLAAVGVASLFRQLPIPAAPSESTA